MTDLVKFWTGATKWCSVPVLCGPTSWWQRPGGQEPAVGRLGLGQVLQRLPLTAHTVVAHSSRDIEAALAVVKVQRWFVPVQDGEIELVAAGSQAQLQDNTVKWKDRYEHGWPDITDANIHLCVQAPGHVMHYLTVQMRTAFLRAKKSPKVNFCRPYPFIKCHKSNSWRELTCATLLISALPIPFPERQIPSHDSRFPAQTAQIRFIDFLAYLL